jgi:hypothetical protein
MTKLPKNLDALSLDALRSNLNDPQRHATPQSTVEAILYCVQTRGVPALKEPGNEERLSRCDEAAMQQIRKRIERMRQEGLLP